MAAANDLPYAIITESGLKIMLLDAAVPDTAQALIDQTAMILPHVKITELLLEVDSWTGFTRHFTHLKSGDLAKDKNPLLTTILADAINLVTAAVVLWNTVYLERATHALRGNGHAVEETLLQYLSPLGWEHIILTGDYLWRSSAKAGAGKFRPLSPFSGS
jgi:hypothetical protein